MLAGSSGRYWWHWGRLELWSGDLLVPEEGRLGTRLDSAGFASVIGVQEAVDSVFGLCDVATASQAITRSTGEVQSVSRGGCIGEPWNPVGLFRDTGADRT